MSAEFGYEFRDYCICCGAAPGVECDDICKAIQAERNEEESRRILSDEKEPNR